MVAKGPGRLDLSGHPADPDATMVPSRISNLEAARQHSGPYADMVANAYLVADPLADAFAEDAASLPDGGFALLDRAIARGIEAVPEAPRSLAALFEPLDQVPAWVDWKRIALGARTYQRAGFAGGLTLSAVCLMNGYHSSAAVKPLLFTGRLTDMARRRLAETGRFVVETIQVDGLRRTRPGFALTVRVRFIHSQVRRALLRDPRWVTADWGVPINQADMLATNLAFSIALIRGLSQVGLRVSREESDALIHLWRYSGYLIGVELGLLPVDSAEAIQRADLIDMLQPGPDDGSRALAEALRAVRSVRRPGRLNPLLEPIVTRYHNGLTRAVLGDAKADALETPHREWRQVVRLLRPVIRAGEHLRESLPLANAVAVRVGNRGWRKAVEAELQGRKAELTPDEVLRRPS